MSQIIRIQVGIIDDAKIPVTALQTERAIIFLVPPVKSKLREDPPRVKNKTHLRENLRKKNERNKQLRLL